jgi:hypothetical protein
MPLFRGSRPLKRWRYAADLQRDPPSRIELAHGLGVVERGLGVVERGLGVVARGLGVVERGLGVVAHGLGVVEHHRARW